ncbi:hypothetical protein Bhyg_11427 [Pseudolycoriella hygida]|uniref:Uncharacterized protein n=1 Tax=Pseudolycoriella hygida TaxID=35572 RepID=A0A9Q0MX53_9DIPT|nr:hypothetical protein Bhyg_11427 [Pseudolycoriella hygida]
MHAGEYLKVECLKTILAAQVTSPLS